MHLHIHILFMSSYYFLWVQWGSLPPTIILNSKGFFSWICQTYITFKTSIIFHHRKLSNFKFPFKIGPFFINSKESFPIVENILHTVEFHTVRSINYDPHWVISHRRQNNKCKDFEHQAIKWLDKIENILIFHQINNKWRRLVES